MFANIRTGDNLGPSVTSRPMLSACSSCFCYFLQDVCDWSTLFYTDVFSISIRLINRVPPFVHRKIRSVNTVFLKRSAPFSDCSPGQLTTEVEGEKLFFFYSFFFLFSAQFMMSKNVYYKPVPCNTGFWIFTKDFQKQKRKKRRWSGKNLHSFTPTVN